MENIGEKIKRIRKEKELTQSNVHENNSKISQIESGKNLNPSAETLQIIAKGLDISFDKLVSETSWNNSLKNNRIQIKMSPLDFNLFLSKNGDIRLEFEQYNAFDNNGLENLYCPRSGAKLISECIKCKKEIIDTLEGYCMSCGQKLFFFYEKNIDLYIKKYGGSHTPFKSTYFINDNNDVKYITNMIEVIDLNAQIMIWGQTDSGIILSPDGYKDRMNLPGVKKEIDKEFITWMNSGVDEMAILINDPKFRLSDYAEGFRSRNKDIAKFCLERSFKEIFYKKLIKELKRYIPKRT